MYVSAQLHPDHDTSGFDSGRPTLDDWLRHSANHAGAKRISRVFVWSDHTGRVVAYYTLSAHQITKDELPAKFRRGEPEAIPAVLIGKLALDARLHGQGIGAAVLAEALGRVLMATRTVAARYVVVDALDERAATFYEKHGFRRAPAGDRLFMKLSSVAASEADS